MKYILYGQSRFHHNSDRGEEDSKRSSVKEIIMISLIDYYTAEGSFLSQALIFKRVMEKRELCDVIPPGIHKKEIFFRKI
jgi:hypothetical protein